MTLSLDAAIGGFQPALPLGVALSAGADSTALLVACAARWPGQVVALHVNHHLQAASADFEERCIALCKAHGVSLRVAHTDARHQSGQSPEDAARIARYQSLYALASSNEQPGPIKGLALGHHADDQVETFLIALSRGAGLAGLSAMPAQWSVGGLNLYRPFLQVEKQTIREWLAARNIGFMEDPTNADPAFVRNRIRASLLPEMEVAFPHFRDTVARSAGHCAVANRLLDDLARQELQTILRDSDAMPQIKELQKLDDAHLGNALRYWLKTRFQAIPSAAQLGELVSQIRACVNRGRQINIKVAQGFVVRQGEVLGWYNPKLLQSEH
jgi:tRNA(Ile)-lysidine synthase